MKRAVAIALAVAVAVGLALYLRREHAALPPPAATQPPATPPAPVRAPDAPLPAPAESDAQVRQQFSGLSTSPALQQWLRSEGLLERGAAAIDNLAEGVSPRKPLDMLAPRTPYAPGRFERYDAFADVIGSVDAGAVAAALKAVHPLLESAYHRLGYPDRSVDDAILRALQRIIDAPHPDAAALAVQPRGALYVYKDPTIESLGAVDKHLLRLGPRNERRIQDKARELAAALRR